MTGGFVLINGEWLSGEWLSAGSFEMVSVGLI